MINTNVLVLNKSFLPVNITTVKKAFCLLYQGIAKAVDSRYQTFDFISWCELSVEVHHEKIGVVDRVIRVPRVIALTTFDRLPKRRVKLSRHNIFARDKNTCQYCGKLFPRSELNLDHVIPRSLGGKTTWENIVCSCHNCNRKKGGKPPEMANMKLLRNPQKPRWTPYTAITLKGFKYEEWAPFLNFVDASYWNVELEE